MAGKPKRPKPIDPAVRENHRSSLFMAVKALRAGLAATSQTDAALEIKRARNHLLDVTEGHSELTTRATAALAKLVKLGPALDGANESWPTLLDPLQSLPDELDAPIEPA